MFWDTTRTSLSSQFFYANQCIVTEGIQVYYTTFILWFPRVIITKLITGFNVYTRRSFHLILWINPVAHDMPLFSRNLAPAPALRQQVLPVSFILRCESCLARVRPGPIWSAVSFFPPKSHTCLPIISNGALIGDNGRERTSERANDAPLGSSITKRKSNDKSAAVADYDIALDSGLWCNASHRKSPRPTFFQTRVCQFATSIFFFFFQISVERSLSG